MQEHLGEGRVVETPQVAHVPVMPVFKGVNAVQQAYYILPVEAFLKIIVVFLGAIADGLK